MSYSHDHRNEVHLAGRVTREAVMTRLPSGDGVVSLWLVVKRPPGVIVNRKQKVDTLELVAWKSSIQEIVSEWLEMDLVAVSGALRHRFWQTDAGARSKYEVEVDDALLLHRPDPAPEKSTEREPEESNVA